MKKVLVLFGTRPEAIKLCALVLHLQSMKEKFEVRVCVTAQHRSMLDGVLERFGVTPEYDLDVMTPNQTLSSLTARILKRLEPVLARERPDFVLVQGDTTTTFAGALAAFYQNIHVGHVEAGLRTGDLRQPFPEEMNRLLTTRLSTLHFAPTARARRNLLADGVVPERVYVTGNTGIDALLYTRDCLESGVWSGYEGALPPPERNLIVVTTHRRENFGDGIESICAALKGIAERDDVVIILPVHRNPNVRRVIERELNNCERIELIDPQDYVSFVDLMRRAALILTDSGGIQEEAPSLGKRVLVMREKTERQEAVEAGTAILVGTNRHRIRSIVDNILKQIHKGNGLQPIANPFGDGHACERIAEILAKHPK
jgi:UDP-N-acetylglucosamine 2-epimerase (non-hydrolysing)